MLGDSAFGGLPAFCRVVLLFLVYERGERSYDEDATGGLCDAGIAVVDGGVEDNLRVGPGEAFVAGADEFHAAKRTDVSFARAGIGDEEFSVLAADEGGPAGESGRGELNGLERGSRHGEEATAVPVG